MPPRHSNPPSRRVGRLSPQSASGTTVPPNDHNLRSRAAPSSLPSSAASTATTTVSATTTAVSDATTTFVSSTTAAASTSTGPSVASAAPANDSARSNPVDSASVALGKRKERSTDDGEFELVETLNRYRLCLTSLAQMVGIKGVTVDQARILLQIKRLEKQPALVKVKLLKILAEICAAYKEAAIADFGRVQELIDVNLALSNSIQDDVNALREFYGKELVFSKNRRYHWDFAAEASSSVNGDSDAEASGSGSQIF